MNTNNDSMQGDVLMHLLLIAFLFSAFGFFSYQIGFNSAEKANLIAERVVEEKAFDSQPALFGQNMNEKAITASINYSDTGE